MNIDPKSKAEQARQRQMRRQSVVLREKVRSTTACPKCRAIAGDYCTTKSGKFRVALHAERWRAQVIPTNRNSTRASDLALIQEHVEAGRVLRYPTIIPDETEAAPSRNRGGGRGRCARSSATGLRKRLPVKPT